MINAIFAVDFNGGMGFNGTLPWPHNAEDLANFKKLTTGHIVVCGRKTWEDAKMPKPLPGRQVYVATHKSVAYATAISGDIKERLLEIEEANLGKTVFVMGGAELLTDARDLYDRIYLTHIRGSYRNDTRVHLKEFLSGFIPVRAQVSQDFQSVFTTYDPLFKRAR
jgi:dihydrofolate reductase